MSLCPANGRPCCDDLCYGGGCMKMDGYPMLERCDFCKGTINTELPECGTCTCGDDQSLQLRARRPSHP